MRVLLVEDDPMIGDALRLALQDAAYAVDWAPDAAAAEALLRDSQPQAVVLDLALPDIDGIELLRRMRAARCMASVLVITARDAVDARVHALDCGADDYLVKPFAVEEFLARLRAVIRRQSGQPAPLLTNGIISLDPATRVASRAQASMVLSSREFALLRALLLRPGAILSRTQIEERVYGPGDEVQSNAVEFLIHGIRRKFGHDTIRNVRGAGWMVERPR
ncbi:MAG TPA: response regulator transcription factor [Usitatibacter sp.]|nr:response regulator transcription factor [Usitatibacter sp.]